jgi:uncharacterized protein
MAAARIILVQRETSSSRGGEEGSRFESADAWPARKPLDAKSGSQIRVTSRSRLAVRWRCSLGILTAVEIGLFPVLHTPPAAAQTEAAGDEQKTGNYAAAIQMWASRPDDPDALFNLGQLYRLGAGVTRDTAKAYDYYRRAAEKGHIAAQVLLARHMLEKGDGAGAVTVLKPAAIQGDAEASFLLGSIYVNGDGVPRNIVLGQAYLLSADLAGLEQARPQAALVAQGMSAADKAAARTLALSLRASVLGDAKPAAPLPKATVAAPPNATRSAAIVTSTAAPARTRATNGWLVQLGAYSSTAQAQASWTKIKTAIPLLRSERPIFEPYQELVRLRVAMASKAAANRVCEQAAQSAQPCFVVAPPAAAGTR